MTVAIADATQRAYRILCEKHPEHFYYFALITTGEAHAPFPSAWSHEAYHRAATERPSAEGLKWSYADSPYCFLGEECFASVNDLFAQRPEMTYGMPEAAWTEEWNFRLSAMEAALARLDAEGLFGRGEERDRIYINVEVMPPDYTNTERALRLNSPNALKTWLAEAAEPLPHG